MAPTPPGIDTGSTRSSKSSDRPTGELAKQEQRLEEREGAPAGTGGVGDLEGHDLEVQLVSNLCHELRTPLATMLTSLEVLRHPNASDAQRNQAIDRLERNLRAQSRVIQELLDLSRVLSKRVALTSQPLDLVKLVVEQTGAFEPDMRLAGLALSVEIPPKPITVLGDAARLGQVISNLLANAVELTSPGAAVAVTVATEDNAAIVRVADTGNGVAPELLPRLFEPFRRPTKPPGRNTSGFGSGLYVARSLAELHGGTLDGFSAGLGQGSETVLRLPLLAGPADERPACAAAARRANALRILVVEDESELRTTMAMLLELMGHEVVTARDATTAVEIARREPLDLAFLDIGLPDIDGYALAQRLREAPETRALELIALTGRSGPAHQARANHVGFRCQLAKPVTAEDLRRVLEAQLEAPEPR